MLIDETVHLPGIDSQCGCMVFLFLNCDSAVQTQRLGWSSFGDPECEVYAEVLPIWVCDHGYEIPKD